MNYKMAYLYARYVDMFNNTELSQIMLLKTADLLLQCAEAVRMSLLHAARMFSFLSVRINCNLL